MQFGESYSLISKVEHLVDLSCSPVPHPLVQSWSCLVTFYPESSPVSVVEARQVWLGPARIVKKDLIYSMLSISRKLVCACLLLVPKLQYSKYDFDDSVSF